MRPRATSEAVEEEEPQPDMACAEHPSFSKRAWRAGTANPRSILLALFGAGVFVAGILLRNETAGITLIVLGSAVVCLGVLLPVVQEASIGTEGFKFTRLLQERDDEFGAFVETQKNALQRLIVMTTGDPKSAVSVVEDVLAHAYGEWGFVSVRRRTFYLVCYAVRKALGALRIGLAVPDADAVPSGVRPLLALDPEARAAAVLRHYQGLGEDEIARIIDADVKGVQSHLRRAADALRNGDEMTLPDNEATSRWDRP